MKARSAPWPILTRRLFALLLAALAALVMLGISEVAYRHSSEKMNDLGDYDTARINAGVILRRVLEAESGQRGYLLTGREEYLPHIANATKDIEQRIGELEHHYVEDAELTARVQQFETEVQGRLSEIETVRNLYDEGRHESWRALFEADLGRERMIEVQRLAARLYELEAAKIAAGRQAVFDTLYLSRVGVFSMTAISLVALLLYLRQSRALDRQREKHRQFVEDERDQLEREVSRRTAQLTKLAQHLQTVREDERARLARELHDELGALLTAAKLDAARIRSRLGGTAPEALERVAHLIETLNHGIALKRRIIEDLHPSSLANLGLIAAVEQLVRDFQDTSGVAVDARLEPVSMRSDDELTVYRLIQEALTNAAKYAKASEIRVSLRPLGSRVEVEIHDDGVGFDPDRQPVSAHGLTGMRYRVEAADGHLTVDSAPGHGTRIHAMLPALDADRSAASQPVS